MTFNKKSDYIEYVYFMLNNIFWSMVTKKNIRELQWNKSNTINKSILHFILQDLYRPLSSDDMDSVGDSV